MKSRLMVFSLLGMGLVGVPAFAADQARPGTVNYVEGAAYLQGAQLNAQDVGTANLDPGQELSTGKGKAEILLTPGVFLRLDDNSVVKMVSPDLTLTQVALEKGRAGIEVDQIHDQNNLQIVDAGVTTRLNKTGYYEFDANEPKAMVFKGEAHVLVGDGKWEKIKGGQQLLLAEGANEQMLAKEKPQGFNQDGAKDDFYNWNSLRSQYMAEANNQMAMQYTGSYVGPGWYWNPWTFGYAYMGWGPFASPFGWGFYPFGWAGYPIYGGYVGRAYYGGRYWHDPHPGYVAHGTVHNGNYGNFRNSGGYEGFHNTNNGAGFSGFHGGGGFGGFHGGGGHGR